MSTEIIQNLIDFYLEFKDENAFYQDNIFYSFLGKWPNCNINKINVESTNQKINFNQKSYSKNWILSEDFFLKNKEKIKEAKLFPVGKWTNMILHKKTGFPIIKKDNFTVEILKQQDIKEFIKLINQSFKKEILQTQQVVIMLESAKFTCFAGKYNNKIVSTAVFYNNGKTIGLYFIATDKNYQKKGFGTQTVAHGLHFFINKNHTTFVLHATDAGKKLYENLHFIARDKMRIFVKI